MNGRQFRAIIERERSRLHADARGDVNLALDLSIVERLMVSGMVSAGYARISRHPDCGHHEVPPSIEDPGTGTEHQTVADTDPGGE